MSQAPNSRNPANDDSLTGMLKVFRRKLLQSVDGMLPAIVEEHDRENNRVRVRPLIAMVDTNDQVIRRGIIQEVPVLNLGGGGFFINFHLPQGSLGWIEASDRDISLFLQSYREAKPNTLRTQSFSDARFIPDVMTGYTIADEDAEAMVIQNLDGSVKIALDENGIRMDSDGDMTIDVANAFTLTANTITMTAPGGINLNGVTIDSAGALASPTSVTAPQVTGSTEVTFGSINASAHVHGGVQTGSGETGGPQ